MKGELQMIKELVVGAMLASGVTQVAAPQLRSGAQPQNPQATWSYVNELEDGAVYFIRNVVDDDKVMDVYNHDYTNSGTVKLWDSNGQGNQRFIVHKRNRLGYSNDNIYTFTPINAQNICLTVQDKSNSDNKRLKTLSDTACDNQTTVNKYYSNSFKIVSGSSEGRFKIQTGASGFTKYLTTYNYGSDSGTDVVQKTYNSVYYECYEWYFQRVDNLGIYAKNEAVINGQNWQQFWLKVPSDGVYTIQTLKREYNTSAYIDTWMELTDDQNGNSLLDYNDNDDNRTGNDYRLSRIDYYLEAGHSYGVRVRGLNGSSRGDIYIDVTPAKAITVCHNVHKVSNASIRANTKASSTGFETLPGAYIGEEIVYQEILNANGNDFIKPNGTNVFSSYYLLYMWDKTYNSAYDPSSLGLFPEFEFNGTKLAIFAYRNSGWTASCANTAGAEYSVGFGNITDIYAMKFACYMFSMLAHEAHTVETAYNQALDVYQMTTSQAILYH